ncbi:phage late control D family protein [Salmonella enterica subsp. enterica serovar Panama]|uniref:Phage late control D family protein n=1 Tax=Salmonella enterica subsp. enterica serovar Panama TaxID=29472 RepID=A0A636GAW5_SALET|nr:phage late control D family protein [Salmonella enterica subsp. enterica serovar Panama]
MTDRVTGYGVPAPAFTVVVDGVDVTKKSRSRLISLSLTDNREAEADTLELVLDDTDGELDLPRRGALIHLAIGWQGKPLISKGAYTVDEITHSGAPDQLTITARSADFRASLNVNREQSWHNVTLSDIAKTIATRNKLTAKVQPELAQIKIDHSDQTNESDASYLSRLGREYGFVLNIKNSALRLISAGSERTADGKPISIITITRKSGDQHQFTIADRDAYTGVTAHYINHHRAEREGVTVKRRRKKQHTATPTQGKDPGQTTGDKHQGDYLIGSDENVLVLRHTYASEGNAKRAAKSAWERLQRGTASFSITLATGQPEITPEYPVKVSGFKPAIDEARWTITAVTHEIGDSGLISTLEMEVSVDALDMI